ncbi:A disintegrin and metalloproteinase with thrombospondin motifs 20-like [Chelonus insularis]|uniref:A disintegrin and metalloproteinase with thrombospondin motifs 20-like n=1 Tax=Chelonus insularis TaxID=460826 RepID=UPI0015891CDB|nr:A disintegrin and metalloproteinase with thrombospondin motifs 20-like [Chelonus insularis]
MRINFIIFYYFFYVEIRITSSTLNVHKPQSTKLYHGRFTRDVVNPELLIPRLVYANGTFKSFHLSNYYDQQDKKRKKRYIDNISDKLHLILPFDENHYHVELTPYYDFISPEMVIEERGESSLEDDLYERLQFKRASDNQCHYRGLVRDYEDSRVALSLCDGVAGYIVIDNTRYFIEPIDNSQLEDIDQHVHMIYKREINHEKRSEHSCGTSDDWESAWLEQLNKRERRLLAEDSAGLKRTENIMSSTHSIHRYIEVGLVADKKFLDFHKDRDYENYLLTIMNMVSDFYHDASVGNQIDIVVVRIIYLEKEKEELDLNISPDANSTLNSFANWANKMNPTDPSHPNHYDVAVLVTRHDICSPSTSCDLMGLAFVASVCDPPKAAAICEDTGLLLGVVVAHELGHVMGCSHDEESISGCPAQDKDQTYFVMSPIVSIYSYRWSTCSKQYITSLLNSGLGECLNNNPKNPPEKYKFPKMLPGAMYDADSQCKFHYPDTKLCDLGKGVNCEQLWCRKEKNCLSKKAPPADGTKCGEQKWCIKKKCVDMGTRPEAIHGGWGEWGSKSKCSRTCGGGILVTERECDNPQPSNGGRYCIGERKKINMCNTQPCPFDKPSFRATQCAEFNSKKVSADGLHKWTPYFRNDLDPCLLFCVNENNVFSKLGIAKDATPCKGGTNNICISGTCRKVGCDWVIDSSAVEDKCGVCKGDGTKCKIVEGKYTDIPSTQGYQKIVTIPKGARNVNARENGASENALAIKLEKDNTYCLNGNQKENLNGEYPCAGALIIYSHPETNREVVDIKGPIGENIQLQYTFYSLENPGVSYEYYIMNTVSSGYTPKYLWDFTQWSSCDVNCGGGTMISKPSCIEQQNGIVSDDFCSNIPRPEPLTRICNEEPCPTKWRVSQWSECSGCDGSSGERTRKIQCVKKTSNPGGEDIQVDYSLCKGNAPIQSESCTGNQPCSKKCQKVTRKSNKRDDTSLDIQEFDKDKKKLKELLSVGLASYLEKLEGKGLKRDQVLRRKKKLKDPIDRWLLNKETRIYDEQNDKFKRAEDIQMKTLSTLKPGSIVKDDYPAENSVLLEAPLKADTFKANLSDVAFQEGGDSVPAEIDTSQQKIYQGTLAQKLIIEMANPNATNSPE